MLINQSILPPVTLVEVTVLHIAAEHDSRKLTYDHGSEYISGFSGSAGTAVVTLDKAALATDGRYFNQASQQLDNNWELLRVGIQDVPTWQKWYVYFLSR